MPPFPVDYEKDTICDVIRRWAEIQPKTVAYLEEGKASPPKALKVAQAVALNEGSIPTADAWPSPVR